MWKELNLTYHVNEDNQKILQINFENNIFMRNNLLTSKSTSLFKPFYVNVPSSSPLNKSENLWLSDVFKGNQKGSIGLNNKKISALKSQYTRLVYWRMRNPHNNFPANIYYFKVTLRKTLQKGLQYVQS